MKIKLNPQALAAIQDGITRGDGLAEMEDIGLSQRTINILENHGILTLEDLMFTSLGDLASIPHIGVTAINQLLDCLNKYYILCNINDLGEQIADAKQRLMAVKPLAEAYPDTLVSTD